MSTDDLVATVRVAIQTRAPMRTAGALDALDALAALVELAEEAEWKLAEVTAAYEAAVTDAARAAKLGAALRGCLDDLIWMSGSPSFGPEGEAHEGWRKVRDRIDTYYAALLVPAGRDERPCGCGFEEVCDECQNIGTDPGRDEQETT